MISTVIQAVTQVGTKIIYLRYICVPRGFQVYLQYDTTVGKHLCNWKGEGCN